MGSQLLLSTLLQNTVSGSGGPAELIVQSDGPYDFYRDPNMSQARICLPALEQLSKAVRQRLSDWPEHPALVQVREAATVSVIAIICFRFFEIGLKGPPRNLRKKIREKKNILQNLHYCLKFGVDVVESLLHSFI